MRHRILLLTALVVLAWPDPAAADAYVVTGRTPADRDEAPAGFGSSRWSVDLGAGILAGGDLFQVSAANTTDWPTPRGGSFAARRFDVTVDEDAVFRGGLAFRLGTRASLRLDLSYAQVDLTALANDSQYVRPVPWDRADLLQAGLVWEQRLTETRLRPYGLLGVGLRVFSAADGALDQSGPSLLVGAGALFRILRDMDLRLEVRDGIRQISSTELVGDLLPPETDLTERGPQHLVAMTLGLRMTF